MTTKTALKGQCLCGKVTITATLLDHSLGACHCDTCRRWGGGPYLSTNCGEVTFEGSTATTYDSSEWAQRSFCCNCGTHLSYMLKQNQQYFMPAGLFDELKDMDFDHQVFIDGKPPYYDFANETKNMTGEEAFAAFTPPE